jgi:multisubunit Na+/H+ antiporter MnhE subunit
MRSSRAWTARAAGLALRAAALYLVWLVIDDNVAQPELLTGVVVALLALALAVVVRRSSTVHAQVRISMLRHAWRLPLLLIADTVRVSATVLRTLTGRRGPQGRLRAVRYRATTDSSPDVGRRVLTEWGASIAPNRYVIGIDREAEVLLVHELAPAPREIDPLKLG